MKTLKMWGGFHNCPEITVKISDEAANDLLKENDTPFNVLYNIGEEVAEIGRAHV